jgi:hypothetical protein
MPDIELAKILGWEGEPPPVEWRWIEYPERPLDPGEAPVCRGWARPRVPLLITARSEIASSGRALTRREVYTQKGVLVASINQEGLIPVVG